MDIGLISLLISAVVGGIQLLTYLSHKETNLSEDLDRIKKDIIQIQIENGVCLSDRHNHNEDIKNTIRLLEKLNDKLDDYNDS